MDDEQRSTMAIVPRTPHDYEVFFSDETWGRQNPDMVLDQLDREEAFGRIGNLQCKFGEAPVAVLEDNDDVLDPYFDWCGAGGIVVT